MGQNLVPGFFVVKSVLRFPRPKKCFLTSVCRIYNAEEPKHMDMWAYFGIFFITQNFSVALIRKKLNINIFSKSALMIKVCSSIPSKDITKTYGSHISRLWVYDLSVK